MANVHVFSRALPSLYSSHEFPAKAFGAHIGHYALVLLPVVDQHVPRWAFGLGGMGLLALARGAGAGDDRGV